ncbi:hypothetical protein M7I_6447 [Glarea lozoyensis 74030]|uniref:Cytochrome c oxidase subunit 6B-like protein new16 n=1 Tax=Glarea lozoyensis (strain ATCC 74030 / MF5533) TaxID=1104152 RepID=H0EUL0_GLAL7|nr:hypothetical protein M7I_6447 [Glarea lozoyensis 74030]
MGLFGSAPATLPPPKISSDGAPIAPDRTQRANITEKDKAEKFCSGEGRKFEANCASSWVTYFKKRRVMEHQKNETLEKLRAEGAKQVPGEMAPPGSFGQRP